MFEMHNFQNVFIFGPAFFEGTYKAELLKQK